MRCQEKRCVSELAKRPQKERKGEDQMQWISMWNLEKEEMEKRGRGGSTDV